MYFFKERETQLDVTIKLIKENYRQEFHMHKHEEQVPTHSGEGISFLKICHNSKNLKSKYFFPLLQNSE